MQSQYNMRSPAVKRLMKEAQELRDPTEQYHVQPLDDNLFEWHFTIRGPADSDFDGGIYHGRIILPPDYPMKPPSIILLTPNGRFEVFKKICLSISGHHPESWQPSWSIRTALLAIIGFMPTHGAGAIGSLDYTPEERKILAKKSQDWKCPNCGPLEKMLLPVTQASEKTTQEAKELASQINFQGEKSKTSESSSSTSTKEAPDPESQETTNSSSSVPASPVSPASPAPSNPATPSAQSQTQFPWNQFMGGVPPNLYSPSPFPMPFMQPGNSNTMVPRFPLPCYAPMVPPGMFPSGFPHPNAGPWPPQQPAPPTAMNSSQSGSNTVSSSAPSPSLNESESRGVENDSTSTKPNTTTNTYPSTTSVTSNSINQTGTQNATNAPSSSLSPPSSPSSSQSSTNSSDTAPTSGLRQRTTTANTRQATPTFQSAELTTPARSDGRASLVLIIVLSCAIGLLLFRRIYLSFEWSSLFR